MLVTLCLNPYSNGMRIEQMLRCLSLRMECLNPYSNGLRIEQTLKSLVTMKRESLNPYSNGMRIEHGKGCDRSAEKLS